MKALRTAFAAALTILLAGACDAVGLGGGHEELQVGRYSYASGRFSPTVRAGVLVITKADQDSIDGRWEVSGFKPEISLRGWNESAYLVWATGSGGAYAHRIARNGRNYTCSLRVIGGGESIPEVCEVTYIGP